MNKIHRSFHQILMYPFVNFLSTLMMVNKIDRRSHQILMCAFVNFLSTVMMLLSESCVLVCLAIKPGTCTGDINFRLHMLRRMPRRPSQAKVDD